jgi:trans-aconitate methyltransferase
VSQVAQEYAGRTLAAYRVRADAATASWSRSGHLPLLRRFSRLVTPGGHVLDYGCGTGHDVAWLNKRRFAVTGIDGLAEFVEAARDRCPQAMVTRQIFDQVRLQPEAYDGIWSNAALMHMPPRVLRQQLRMIRGALRPGGMLGLVMAWGHNREYVTTDWIPGRYMATYTKTAMACQLEPWTTCEVTVIRGQQRPGRWLGVLATR